MVFFTTSTEADCRPPSPASCPLKSTQVGSHDVVAHMVPEPRPQQPQQPLVARQMPLSTIPTQMAGILGMELLS